MDDSNNKNIDFSSTIYNLEELVKGIEVLFRNIKKQMEILKKYSETKN